MLKFVLLLLIVAIALTKAVPAESVAEKDSSGQETAAALPVGAADDQAAGAGDDGQDETLAGAESAWGGYGGRGYGGWGGRGFGGYGGYGGWGGRGWGGRRWGGGYGGGGWGGYGGGWGGYGGYWG